ncbi:hypothetical protein ACIHEI_21190 [Kitasatospora sp. NPDC051984]|uniref:hypothetical protein n=1 Tax=Kitasatospora sp. NPDC051984 TaxID=3364059 RepID=UPI0037C750EC
MADDRDRRSERMMAIVCHQHEHIRDDLADDPAPLQRVIGLPPGSPELADALDTLHAAVQATGDPEGLFGYAEGGSTREVAPLGHRLGRVEFVYRCPQLRCSGRPWQRGSEDPVCGLSGLSLQLVQV